jgi:hypothetical protein
VTTSPPTPTLRLRQLAVAALLGTDRGGIAEASPQRLLDAAALAGAQARAGFKPRRVADRVPPCPTDTTPIAPRAAMATLQRMLTRPDPLLIEEWAELAQARGVRVAPAVVPALLAWWSTQPRRSPRIFAACGKTGPWLASLNPAWQRPVATETIPDDADALWGTGTPPERLALLRTVRAMAPARALAMVQSTWASDGAAERQSFVKELAVNCTADDEPFLESTLDERSRGVRHAAVGVLAGLPDSRFRQRMTDRLRAMIIVQGRAKRLIGKAAFTLEPPKALDPTWLRDGFDDKAGEAKGRRATWLQHTVAHAHRSVWLETTGLSASAVVAALAKDDYAQAALAGLFQSVMALPDPQWAAALVDHALDQKRIDVDSLSDLIAGVPQELAEQLALRCLKHASMPPADRWVLAAAVQHRWSTAFAAAAIPTLAAPVAANRSADRVSTVFAELSWIVPPQTAEPLIQALHAALDGEDNAFIRESISRLQLRSEMYKEFAT